MKLEGIELGAYCLVKYRYNHEVVSKIVEVTKDYFCVSSAPNVRFNHDGSFRYNTTTKSRSETTSIIKVFANRQEAVNHLVSVKQREQNDKHYIELRIKCIKKAQALMTFKDINALALHFNIEHTSPVVTEADVELP